jgi:nitroimidazol reductase NimA-like FMN-containing flavoprotein (pyridoxamine 5'-phosphate oxidase superfamily)
VPVYFAYADRALYSFATVGKKIEWMRANPLVCVEVDEVVSPQQWVSVIAFGHYEELPDTPEWLSARAFAHERLKRTGMWWEPAYVKTILGGAQRPLVPVFYRIHIVQTTGHQASPDPVAPPAARPSTLASREAGWLQTLLRQVRGQRRQ